MSATPSKPDPAGLGPAASVEPAHSEGREKLTLFLQNKLGVFGLILVILFFLSAIFAPVFSTHDPFQMDIPNRMSGPTADHWAGTDQLGRDTYSRVLYGGRVALEVAAIGVSVSLAIGLALGMIAGYGPRWLDNLLLLIFDTIRSFPTIVLALAAVALLGPSLKLVLVRGQRLSSAGKCVEIAALLCGLDSFFDKFLEHDRFPVSMSASRRGS